MTAVLTALGAAVLAAWAEWLHARRIRRVTRLAFGPEATPRAWTRAVPFLRVGSLTALAWGLVTLALIASQVRRPQLMPEGGYRHLIVILDVSPSMQIRDAGPDRTQTRAQRASTVLFSLLERVAVDQMRISVIAFYNGARPVVVDTYDLEVVRNIINDLPLDYAFDHGKTKLFAGLAEAAALAKPWQEGSTTLVVASDGDTVPDQGMPAMPRAVAKVIVLGVGSPHTGKFIDGHQSRQDAATLRQVATRLGGVYHDANEKHLASEMLTEMATAVPMEDVTNRGRREAALAATAAGAAMLALLPVLLAFCGAAWHVPRVVSRSLSPTERPAPPAGRRTGTADPRRPQLTPMS